MWDYHGHMRVIDKRILLHFAAKQPRARQSLLAWHEEAVKAKWSTPQDIEARYVTPSFVGHNRVIFNIKGNDYRLVAAIDYSNGVVYVKFVGTHADCDRIDAATVELEQP